MRYGYDAGADILTITLSRSKPDFGEQNENIIMHYSKKGLPIEIEMLEASKTVGRLIETMFKQRKIS